MRRQHNKSRAGILRSCDIDKHGYRQSKTNILYCRRARVQIAVAHVRLCDLSAHDAYRCCRGQHIPLDSERALAVMAAQTGQLPEGHSFRVRSVGGGVLWSGACVDDAGMPYAGGAWLIGPDERVWTVSSNPGIHDYDLGVELLEAAYRSTLSDQLDSAKLSERLAQLTQRRRDDVRTFLRDLRAGLLRDRGNPRLP